MIGTLKQMEAKREAEEGGRDWPRHFQRLLSIYNARYHRSLGMAPRDVTLDNVHHVIARHRRKAFSQLREQAGRRQLFKPGTLVRIVLPRPHFSKVSAPRNSEEIYVIGRVLFTLYGPRYKLYTRTEPKEPIIGTFAVDEFAVVKE